MPTFSAFANVLPDPANPITDAGYTDATGNSGPGFAGVNFQSVTDTQVSRTISGRGIQRDGGSQHWEFSLSYNPMFRAQFDPVYTFLLGRNPRRDPFYVIVPQYSKPKDSVFAAWAAGKTLAVLSNVNPGTNVITVAGPSAFSGSFRPGDMFNIADNADFLHQKIYMVTAVETNAIFQAGTTQPTTTTQRLHIAPPLQRAITSGATVNVFSPKFRVIAKSDVLEYSLNTDNLYSFSLNLEEIQG